MIDRLQHFLNSYTPRPYGDQREYAVLIPLIKRNGDWHVLYEVRASHISQGGQVSFPGGGVDDGELWRDAAIRETNEELNIEIKDISVLGEIDFIVTHWATIHAFVGILNIDFEKIEPNEEVERIFTVPLSDLLRDQPRRFYIDLKPTPSQKVSDEQIPLSMQKSMRKVTNSVTVYDIPGENLWGFTADLTARFVELYNEAFQTADK